MRNFKRLISSILLIVLLVQQVYTPVLGNEHVPSNKNKLSSTELLNQSYRNKGIWFQENNVFKYAIFSGDRSGKLEFEARRVNIEGNVHSKQTKLQN